MNKNALTISERELKSFLGTCQQFSKVSSASCELLAGDGSGRSFYRVKCQGAKINSAVLLNTPEGIGPKLSGNTSYSQEQAFVELCKFYPRVGIPAPNFYGYDPKKNWILMEDVGDLALYRFLAGAAKEGKEQLIEEISETLGEDPVLTLFNKAINLISILQKIEQNQKIIAFNRFLSFENYRLEISEFSEFYAEPLGLQAAASKELEKVYDSICETIMSFPKALSLFDFNAHNLFVSAKGELRVLDFQDSCLVSPARDIVSLINDRGMDDLLGKTKHSALLKFFVKELQYSADFEFIYNMTLLHWDLRVTGRFVKLNQKFKTDKYQQWIPSTLRRLGRTLQRAEKTLHGLDSLLEVAYKLSPEVREGFTDPWKFPEL
jgi:aminoglycoside/choline kinase family phosphotransferase